MNVWASAVTRCHDGSGCQALQTPMDLGEHVTKSHRLPPPLPDEPPTDSARGRAGESCQARPRRRPRGITQRDGGLMRAHFTLPTVLSGLALVVALSGTALAATSVLIKDNSQVAAHTIAGASGPAHDNKNIIGGS